MGDAVGPLELREGDHWHDLILRFNQLLPRLVSPSAASKHLAGTTEVEKTNDLDCPNDDPGHEAVGLSGVTRDSS
jgi:hypothetical protein